MISEVNASGHTADVLEPQCGTRTYAGDLLSQNNHVSTWTSPLGPMLGIWYHGLGLTKSRPALSMETSYLEV